MPRNSRPWTGPYTTLAAVGAAAALLLSAGCAGPKSEASDDGAVQIGFLGNLTGGAAASFGIPFQRGMDLALADASAALGDAHLKVDVVTEDAKSEVPAAVTGYNKLTQKGVPVVVNDSQSPLGQAVAPLANDDKVAFLSGAGSELENKDGYAFRFTDLGTPTLAVGPYLLDHGATRVGAVVASDNPSFATLADATEKGLPDGYASRQEVSSSDTDFSAVLANLRKDDVDAVVLSVLPAQAGNLLLQMKQSGGFEGDLLAGTVAISSETYQVAQDAAAGFVFPQVWAPGQASGSGFEAAYEDKYDEAPTAYGALGYQVGWILVAALIAADDAGDVTGTSIRDALPAASTSDLVKEHGILTLELTAEGAAKSTGVIAAFGDDGTIQVAGS
jgi:ABC-type branched-subunit amino acid transport system substrate-binding protein